MADKKEATIYRYNKSDQGTRGIISAPGFFCHTLELPDRNNQPNISCIPTGEYECLYVKIKRRIGGRRELYWLKHVDGRTGVLIHAGVFAGDKSKGFKSNVLGCIQFGYEIGQLKGQQAIFRSRECIADFIEYMNKEPFKLIIKEVF